MKAKNFLIFLLFLPITLFSQPTIQWQKCIGDTGQDAITCSDKAHNGGYILGGIKYSCNGVSTQAWMVRIDNQGQVLWERCYGGSGTENIHAIRRTTDGGYIFTGPATSNDGDVIGHHGPTNADFWVVKTDSGGAIQWQKCLGGTGSDVPVNIRQTNTGDYIVGGSTQSNDGDVTSGGYGNGDFWIVKLDGAGSGNILWQQKLGSSAYDVATDMAPTDGDGCIVVGRVGAADGDVSQGISGGNWWIVKLGSNGSLQWERTHSGYGAADQANCISQTIDGGYIVLGNMWNPQATPGIYHGMLKLSATGVTEWSKPVNGYRIIQTTDFGYATVADERKPKNASDKSVNIYLRKFDTQGDSVWSMVIGGSQLESCSNILQTQDGGYLLVGTTRSNDLDVSGNNGGQDGWVIKIAPDPLTAVNEIPTHSIQLYPNPAHDVIYFSETVNVRVLNFYGQVVEDKRKARSINLDNQPNGVYLLLFFNDTGVTIGSEKVVKQ